MLKDKVQKSAKEIENNKLKYFLWPAIIIPLLVGIIPYFTGIGLSFSNWKLALSNIRFVGLRNYIEMFTNPDFWNALKVTGIFSGVGLIIQITIGFFVGWLLSVKLKGVSFFRSIILIPLMVAPVLSALMWKLMLPQHGIINYLLSFLGIPAVSWLSNPNTALMTLVCIDAYINIPFVAIIIMAGFQALPKEPYEAAAVDGASKLFIFKKITFPLITPLILIALVFRLIISLKTFDIIYAATGGGPGNLTTNLHLLAYMNIFKYGQGAKATSIVLILFILIFYISYKLVKRWTRATEYQK